MKIKKISIIVPCFNEENSIPTILNSLISLNKSNNEIIVVDDGSTDNTPKILKKYRKFALVIVLILSAIITPPDIASQVIVAIPILILYQISIYISALVIRTQRKTKS